MKMKTPELEIVRFSSEDVIATSGIEPLSGGSMYYAYGREIKQDSSALPPGVPFVDDMFYMISSIGNNLIMTNMTNFQSFNREQTDNDSAVHYAWYSGQWYTEKKGTDQYGDNLPQ